MLASLIAASIIVRLGVIEAILRFYYLAGEKPGGRRAHRVRSLFWTTTLAALIALPFAGDISEALLEEENAGLARLAIVDLPGYLTLGVRPGRSFASTSGRAFTSPTRSPRCW